MTFRIETVTTDDDDPFADLSTILRSYNQTFTGAAGKHQPLGLLARDDAGRVIGGLRGYSMWSWVFVDMLAVDEAHRKTGIGSKLLAEAETIAKARGCIGIYLWTTDFQGPKFYPRHGYSAFGSLPEMPPGHTSQWFMKRLS
jgi:GNAT superfamily N-acetyltransferase